MPGMWDTGIDGASIDVLTDVDTTTVPPNIGDALIWDGSRWVPQTVEGGDGDAYPSRARLRKARRTAGNISLNSTAWANVDTGLDLTLSGVQPGDQLVYGLIAVVGSENVQVTFDVVTVVAGSVTNSFAQAGTAVASGGSRMWFCPAGVHTPLSHASPPYTAVAGDIASGEVTLRLRYSTLAASTKVLNASSNYPLDVWARNLGPLQS